MPLFFSNATISNKVFIVYSSIMDFTYRTEVNYKINRKTWIIELMMKFIQSICICTYFTHSQRHHTITTRNEKTVIVLRILNNLKCSNNSIPCFCSRAPPSPQSKLTNLFHNTYSDAERKKTCSGRKQNVS